MKITKLKQYGPKKNKVMNLNRFLGKSDFIKLVIVFTDLILFFCWNYIVNFIYNFSKITNSMMDGKDFKKYLGFKQVLPYVGENGIIFFFFFLIIIIALDIFIWYKFKISFSEDYFNIGQKGKARWTTKEEIKQQYKEVPDRGNKSFPGSPGTIVAHFDKKLYIDTGINNTLILGITRIGKGEMYIYKTIDVYSRSEEKHSMIVFDPKFENYKSSKKTLIDRGYDVYLLNLDNPILSMGYNPLSLIIDLYKENDKATAYAMARSFAFSIFHTSENGKSEPIWMNTATDLFTALIIAVITDLLNLDESLNEMRVQAYQQKIANYEEMSEEERISENQKIKQCLENGKEPIEDGNIRGLPRSYPYKASHLHEQQINIYNIVILFTELVRKKNPLNPNLTALDEYFNKRDTMDLAKLKYATIETSSEKTKGNIYTNMLSNLGVFLDEKIAKMTAESSLDLETIGFGERSSAVFLAIPDYDKSNHFIASVFIRQLYFILAKKATNTPQQACKIPVRFILDEFGNMPSIEGMDEIMTVSNGRKIGFDLYVQSYAQIYKHYNDDAQTIIDNCANEVYIKSGDSETLEKISKQLGTETFIDIQRTGDKLSLKKTYMETPTDKPLLRPEQLENLLEGECVITRKIKRKDNQGNNIYPYPIFNNVQDGTQFLYRYMYLTDTFPNPNEIDFNDINNESREHIDLRKRLININEIVNGIDEQIQMKTEITSFESCPNYLVIDQILKNEIGQDYLRQLNINRNQSWSSVLAAIEASNLIKEPVKITIRSAFMQ